MNFASRITRTPIPHNPERGAEVAAVFADAPKPLQNLIEGAAGCSPYLSAVMAQQAEWLSGAFDDPATALQAQYEALKQAPLDQLKPLLRQAKARIAALTALADLGGIWPLEQVTGTLTEFADLAVDVSLKALVAAEIKRGKLPGMGPDDVARAGGMVVLAMGKMGARELNYSSDIDLICLFDETRYSDDDYHDARAAFIRVTRKMSALLSDITGEGYVFRTDLRLRPDPSVTPVCLSMDAAMRYYESLGRTWERAAHIKARPCAGDLQAGQTYLKNLSPFIWRKHLDFAAIQDAHDMRLRIREHKGLGGPITLEGHNMKLGRGGIREIEFFTQTRQIIAGGRDPDLRGRETVPALRALAAKGWVEPDVAELLIKRYRSHREVEHRLQMVNDAQTHDLPKAPDEFDRLAQFMGISDTEKLRSRLMSDLTEVHELTEGFFAPTVMRADPNPDLSEGAQEIMARWGSYPALRSARAVEIFERLRPDLLARLQKAANPAEALAQFDGFLAGLPAGVQLFSLFQANPQLIDLIIDICTTTPALARHLSRNSQVLDAVLGGSFFEPWPGAAVLEQELAAKLAAVEDYESKLDTARRWKKEWHFRIGVHHLRGLIDAQEAGQQYADLAGASVAALWHPVVDHFAQKHGAPPGRGAMVLGMGSLGAGQLNATSDLDLIVIYDADGVEASDGRRPLQARPYYARLTQALVTALSAPMAEGRLYEVDMRLRPSGRQGPVATSLQSFMAYQQDEAWTWEHLALTRARSVAGNGALGDEIEAFRATLLADKGKLPRVLPDVADMRARLAEAKPARDEWEAKLGAGRMQDIELVAETAALLAGDTARDIAGQLEAGERIGWLTGEQRQILQRAYDMLWRLRGTSKLLSEQALNMGALGEGARAFVLRELGADSVQAAGNALDTVVAASHMVVDGLLPVKMQD
ncbi:glutamine-synthetase adenylyltransferase [Profundibacter sp.]|uniref:[protein-PII] uridylyltransferase family protein n=1 Tax=Profundibacter sp. TaxID=3101071 RepID=UPI003D097A44